MSTTEKIDFEIRTIKRVHYDQWLPLWLANNPNGIDHKATEHTWKQLTTKKEPVTGLGVYVGPDKKTLVGFLHFVLHPVTGQIEPVCYMQDLFIAPDRRRQGLARCLLSHLRDLGKTQKWSWIYWTVAEGNISAQKLYQDFGIKMPMNIHLLIPETGQEEPFPSS